MYKATLKSLPKGIDAVEYSNKTFEAGREVEVTNAEKEHLSSLEGYEFSFSEVESGSKRTAKKSDSKSASSAMDNVEGDVSPTVPDVDAAADTLGTTDATT